MTYFVQYSDRIRLPIFLEYFYRKTIKAKEGDWVLFTGYGNIKDIRVLNRRGIIGIITRKKAIKLYPYSNLLGSVKVAKKLNQVKRIWP